MDKLIYGGTEVTISGSDETFLVAENVVVVDAFDAVVTKPMEVNGKEMVRLLVTFKGNQNNGDQAVAFTALVDFSTTGELIKILRTLMMRVPMEYRET